MSPDAPWAVLTALIGTALLYGIWRLSKDRRDDGEDQR